MTPEERARLICSEFVVVERRHWLAILAHEFRLAETETRERCARIVEERMRGRVESDIVGEMPTEIPAAIRASA